MKNYKLIMVMTSLLLWSMGGILAGDGQKVQVDDIDNAVITENQKKPVSRAPANTAAGEEIPWQVISSGGTEAGSANYDLRGSVGQVAVGSALSTNYLLSQGFWQADQQAEPPNTGIVYISLTGDGAGPDAVICGKPLTINIHFNNNTDTTVNGSSNGFRLYSPGGAIWDLPVCNSYGSLEGYYDGGTFTYCEVDGTSEDTVGISGFSLFTPGLPVGFDTIVMTVETQFDVSHVGDTFCIDSTWYPPGNTWLWAFRDGTQKKPQWQGPYCFPLIRDQGAVYCTISGPGTGANIIRAGIPFSFDIHFNNSTGQNVIGSTNGFRIYSPDGAAWQTPAWDTTGGLGDYYDGGVFINTYSWDGFNEDSIGLGGFSMFGGGIPAGYDDTVLTVSTWVNSNHTGKTLCIDSTIYNPPIAEWLWSEYGGDRVYPSWNGPCCYVVLECCNHDGIRGDANYDMGLNVADLTYLVDYLFKGGPAPPCPDEADINGDGPINVADLTYLVDYLFKNGQAPAPCAVTASSSATLPETDDITLTATYADGLTVIRMESDVDVCGVQIELLGTSEGSPAKLADDNLELFVYQKDTSTRVGILDLEGGVILTKGAHNLLQLPGKYEIIEAIISDINHVALMPSIDRIHKNTALPDHFALYQNYPNPFNPYTTISFALPIETDYELTVYNIMGQMVTNLSGHAEPGILNINWDASALASGVYLYKLTADIFTETRKMMLLK